MHTLLECHKYINVQMFSYIEIKNWWHLLHLKKEIKIEIIYYKCWGNKSNVKWLIFLTLNICVPNKLQFNYNIAIYNITIFKISGWVTLLPEFELKTKDNIRKGSQKKHFLGFVMSSSVRWHIWPNVHEWFNTWGRLGKLLIQNWTLVTYMELLINNLISSRNLNHILTYGREYYLCWDPRTQVGT